MIIAVIPVKGRLLLIPHTIRRIRRVVDHIVCVTEYAHERDICKMAGAHVTTGFKMPLGRKWNGGFEYARKMKPDHILYVGSSDWVSDNWCKVLLSQIEDNDYIGTSDFYEMHLEYDIPFQRDQNYNIHSVNKSLKKRHLGYWKGYTGDREGEAIGIGRILSKEFLDRIDWKPFDDGLVKNLDYSMTEKAIKKKTIQDDRIKSLSISTTLWPNRHNFQYDMNNEGSVILEDHSMLKEYFPETYKLF